MTSADLKSRLIALMAQPIDPTFLKIITPEEKPCLDTIVNAIAAPVSRPRKETKP